MIAFAACLTQTANANLNHATNMNETSTPVSQQCPSVKPRPHRYKDLEGCRFGRLVALRLSEIKSIGKKKAAHWLCRCDCGVEKSVPSATLTKGRSTSCGCRRTELLSASKMKHGGALLRQDNPVYFAWMNMRARCWSPKHPEYANYGGRGISVCERWKAFVNFRDDMGERPSGRHSLERIENSEGYGPGNVIWATPDIQSNNTRRNRRLTLDGRTLTHAQWDREIGARCGTVSDRIRCGWTEEQAIKTPVAARKPRVRKKVKNFIRLLE